MGMRRPHIQIDPGDVPPALAARRMGLSEADFLIALPELLKRGFPEPDETTGNFDLTAIDEWRRQRHHRSPFFACDAESYVPHRLTALFRHG